ncbi:Disease resistance protein [Corchorus capsularis]|uniref:Disease resistance protein n=1 Tax=Corchorus capsularis TaxID=210143 RepID=A0A1R3HJX3_COCAP|nr:Disease resistance protein [Corchorus capsularis]
MDAEVVVSLLSRKLQKLLRNEAIALTPEVKNHVQKTTHQLNLFRQLLKETEKNQALAAEMNSSQCTNHLLRALYSVDDAVETFLIRKAFKSQHPFTSFFNNAVFIKENKKFLKFISKKGNLLKDKQQGETQDVADNNIPGSNQLQRWGRISGFCFDDECHVVGLEEQVKDLVALVGRGAEQGNQPAVISMVGEGGSGKTAIARFVYDRVDIKRNFTSRAWVHVTKEFKVRDVLVDMISQLDEKFGKEPLMEDELKWRIPKLLGQGRFLIVIDDVEAPELWEAINEVFPPSSHGGVVIVTTRNANVAVPAGSTLQTHSKSFSAKKSQLPVRRLATYSNILFSTFHVRQLRSYVSFDTLKGGIAARNSSMLLNKIMRKINLGVFRVLDLESVYKPQLPKAVGALLNLRYLGLRSTAINSLPVSIGILQCLETLDVKHTNITSLPDSLWKLGNLRHLYLNGIGLDSLELLSVGSLNKLQSLCGLSIGTDSSIAETLRMSSWRQY